MAKLSDLIRVFSGALSVPETTVEQYVKALRKEGMLTTGGRGRGAPDIHEGDCARVLLAMLAGSPTHAAEIVKRQGSLVCAAGFANNHDEAEKYPLLVGLKLFPSHTLLEALTALITYERTASFAELACIVTSEAGEIPEGSIQVFGSMSVSVDHDLPKATIEVICHWSYPVAEKKYKSDSRPFWLVYCTEEVMNGNLHNIFDPNFVTTSKVNHYVIAAIAQMLNE